MLKDFRLKVIYSQEGHFTKIKEVFTTEESKEGVQLLRTIEGSKCTYTLRFDKGVTLHDVVVEKVHKYEKSNRIFCNGYQSWSITREYSVDDCSKGMKFLGRILKGPFGLDKYNGEDKVAISGKKGRFLSYTYSYVKPNKESNNIYLYGSVSERSGFTIIHHDAHAHVLAIQKDCQGLHNINKYMFTLFEEYGDMDAVLDSYFEACLQYKGGTAPRMEYLNKQQEIYSGFTSWYNFYQDISQRIIERNLYYYSELNPNGDIFQIDDGYQTYVGDWLDVDEKKFSANMKRLSTKISSKNFMPGIWLAPFTVEEKSKIFNEHPDWIIKDEKGRPYKAGHNWSGFYGLDLDNIEVRSYLEMVFDTVIHKWGFKFLKLDFLYNVCMLPRNNKTRGQIMCEAMDFLSDICKDAVLLGCGVPLGPAFWNVDFCRIGPDISLDWDNKAYMRAVVRERVSTRNSVVNSIFRSHLGGRVFLNDPDVFLLRYENTQMSEQEKEILSTVNSAFAQLLFTSDEVGEYDDSQKDLFKQIIFKHVNAQSVFVDDSKNVVLEFADKRICIPLKDNKAAEIEYLMHKKTV